MLLYSKSDNLTLDTFERIYISKLLTDIIEQFNYGFKLLHYETGEKTNITLYSDDSDIIRVFIALSDNKTDYRMRKEKIFSSHVNIYSPFFHSLTYDFTDKKIRIQSLRTTFKLKQLKVLLGKLRVRQFKQIRTKE